MLRSARPDAAGPGRQGPGTRICIHLRRGPRPERNRVHLDIAAPDIEAEVTRLLALGATRVRNGDGYVVLNDPEGNNFCVCQG